MKWILLVLLFLPFSVKSQTLHAILVSDVEDSRLGGTSLAGEGRIMQVLKAAEWGTELKLKTYYHNRATFTANAVRETLKDMQIGDKDVVFFYYTGLGYYAGKNKMFPTFQLKENGMQPLLSLVKKNVPLSVDEVGKVLQSKGARLNVVFADCPDTETDPLLGSGLYTDEDVRKVFLKKLFLGSCGLVKIANARGVNGFTNRFTLGFKQLLRQKFDAARIATWPQLLSGPLGGSHLVSEIKSCSASQRRVTTSYPSYRYSETAGAIGKKLVLLYDISSLKEKNNNDVDKLTKEISQAFRPDASIKLIRRNRYPASDPRSRSETEEMRIDAYLTHLKESTDQIITDIKVDMASVTRTPNYEYLTNLTITEEYFEL